MANPATSIDTILDGQSEQASTHASLPWYNKLIATGVLALAPLVGAYAEEPAKPDAAKPLVTLTKAEETYIKRFEDKVAAFKIQAPPAGVKPAAGYTRLGETAKRANRLVEAAAYLLKSAQEDPSSFNTYHQLFDTYSTAGDAEKKDLVGRKALYKHSIQFGLKEIEILVRMQQGGSAGTDTSGLIASISCALGKTFYDIGEDAQAMKYLKDAKAITPLDPLAQEYLDTLEKRNRGKK